MTERPSPPLHVAILQDRPCHDPAAALDRLDRAAAQASEGPEGARLLITPEMWLGGYHIGAAAIADLAAQAEALTEGIATIARRHGIAILTGLARPGDPRPVNSALLIDSTGEMLLDYDKTHLFGQVDRDQFTPGAALSGVAVLNGWCIATAICFDIEFPEAARALALAGADLIVVPTANMHPYESVATRVVPTRAEENGLFVAYANYCGSEGAFDYCGLSCIVGPDGEDLARAGREPALIRATLDARAMARRRDALDYLRLRRIDIY
ncbi:MAG: carbon-nitrogen hydrolase family protein [Paracoccus sp. (in: a-proteobacteria)]|nr:carbon-nitrogen hydrolase family protein [Paracoccus sp. (in: a-proteobacteria)]